MHVLTITLQDLYNNDNNNDDNYICISYMSRIH